MVRYYRTDDYAKAHRLTNAGRDRVLFFDLDNTLYSKTTGVGRLMTERIAQYFVERLGFPAEEGAELGARYYNDYGLAVKGCVEHLGVDPKDYDTFVDGGLHLDELLKPLEDSVREMIMGLDCRKWIFTNAGKFHMERVVRLLGLSDLGLFEGAIYCDYSEPGFPAKPDPRAYQRAMRAAMVEGASHCYFIDDAEVNVRAALAMGWRAVQIDESDCMPSGIGSLDALPTVFQDLVKSRCE